MPACDNGAMASTSTRRRARVPSAGSIFVLVAILLGGLVLAPTVQQFVAQRQRIAELGAKVARKHLGWYLAAAALADADRARKALMVAVSPAEAQAAIRAVFAGAPGEVVAASAPADAPVAFSALAPSAVHPSPAAAGRAA